MTKREKMNLFFSDDTKDQMNSVIDDTLTIEHNFTACILKLTEMDIL